MNIDKGFRFYDFEFYQKRFKYCWFINGFYYIYGFCPVEKENKLYIIFYKISDDGSQQKEFLMKIEDEIFFEKLNRLDINIDEVHRKLYFFHKQFEPTIEKFIESNDA